MTGTLYAIAWGWLEPDHETRYLVTDELRRHQLYIIDGWETFGKAQAWTKCTLRRDGEIRRIYTGTFQECCQIAVKGIEKGWFELSDPYTELGSRYYISK
jgi:hypothetical protein